MTKVVALAGGVGGAKLALGLSKILSSEELSIIVNTGDDFIHFGLYISPDLDTVMYNLAEISNEQTGWGRKSESWNCFTELGKMNSQTWFKLGDLDLANHLERTRLLNSGLSLTESTRLLCLQHHVKHRVFPMTDQPVSTIINTIEYGPIGFQEYFVKYQFLPRMVGHTYSGIENTKISSEVRKTLQEAHIVIICPSNPWLSIMPILEVDDFKNLIKDKTVVAVSPIVGHAALKGPAAKIFEEKGITPSAAEVAKLYRGLIKGFVLDHQNQDECEQIRGWGIIPLVTDTIMIDTASKTKMAIEVLDFASQIG